MTEKQKVKFEAINAANAQTAKAWRMRENFLELYERENAQAAKSFFEGWYSNVIHSNIKAMKDAAKTIKRHLNGIIHQIGTNISNGKAEQSNSKIAKWQRIAQGYSNFNNLRAAILFFNGKLDLFHRINE